MDIVEMSFRGGGLNKEIAELINRAGGLAVGLCGAMQFDYGPEPPVIKKRWDLWGCGVNESNEF
jgi:hypothetical protein